MVEVAERRREPRAGETNASEAHAAAETVRQSVGGRPGWGRSFDPDRLARLELRMWQAYYRRQPLRLFGLLVFANREQAGVGWPRAIAAALWLTKAAVGFSRASGEYARFEPDVVRGYRMLGLPASVDAVEVARCELRWWVVRREIGLAAGAAAGEAIARLYAAIYAAPEEDVREAGTLRGKAAEIRDRGATADPDGPRGRGDGYWPEVARLLRASYRSLHAAVAERAETGAAGEGEAPAAAAANYYQFLTEWRIPARADEILEVLSDAPALARWWPSVYLDVRDVAPGDATGRGKVVDLWTKGWLPYTLRWQLRVTDVAENGYTIEASGDFVGRGVWTLSEESTDPPATRMVYDWRILAEKGILRRLSRLVKPLFAANHRWAMARGDESLRLEIARRHAAGEAAVLAAIPAPPGPTFPHNLATMRRRGASR